MSADKRHIARILAIQYFFTELQAKKDSLDYLPFETNSLLGELDEKKYDLKLYEQIISGVEENIEKLDKLISEAAPEWPIDQINPVNLIILRCAVWEGFIGKITPYKVAINEAIEASKDFNSPEDNNSSSDAAFVNGVLGKIYKNFESNDKN